MAPRSPGPIKQPISLSSVPQQRGEARTPRRVDASTPGSTSGSESGTCFGLDQAIATDKRGRAASQGRDYHGPELTLARQRATLVARPASLADGIGSHAALCWLLRSSTAESLRSPLTTSLEHALGSEHIDSRVRLCWLHNPTATKWLDSLEPGPAPTPA